MKKLPILIAVIVSATQFSNAQTTTGTQNLGLSLGSMNNKTTSFYSDSFNNNSTTSNESTYKNFNIGATYGYFIGKNLDAGATLSYSFYSSTYSNPNPGSLNKQINNDLGGLIFIRKYFLYENKFGFRAGPYLGYDRSTAKSSYVPSSGVYNQNIVTNNYNAGLRLDLVYYPLKRVGFSATIANLSYNTFKSTTIAPGSINGDNINLILITSGLQLSAFWIF